jgi:hypothetical protein
VAASSKPFTVEEACGVLLAKDGYVVNFASQAFAALTGGIVEDRR